FLVYIANKYFIRSLSNKDDNHWLCISSFVGTLAFVYIPSIIDRILHHYWLVLSLAASYLLIAKIDQFMHPKEMKSNIKQVKHILMIAVLLILVATQPQSLFIYFVPMLVIF